MSSSDDDTDAPLEFVSQYYFEDDDKAPVSFSILPLSLNTNGPVQGPYKPVYVRGTTDAGLHKLYKPVKAWKFDISGKEPVISVQLKDNNWIKLAKPRNSYEDFIRTVLVAVYFLHLVRRSPESGKGVWDKLSRIFRLHEERPSPHDLIDQKELIEKAIEHDDALKKSKYLMSILEKNSWKKKRPKEDVLTKRKSDFIVHDDDPSIDDPEEEGSADEEDGFGDNEDGSGDEKSGSDDEDDDGPFDSVCCICDNGGSLLICEGSCMRSFHATPRAAKDASSGCLSLGFSEKEVEDMGAYICPNCQSKQHQCYSCGKLGSSDKDSGAEVFQCVNATCGYYYHPHCVSKRLHRNNAAAAEELEKKIASGESFTCPLHVCFVCKQPEVKTIRDLQMAVCRRCPKAYHRKCKPSEIAFEDENVSPRAWETLLVDRILIYCLKHTIIEDLGTPPRDHITFPDDHELAKRWSKSLALENKAVPTRKMPPVRTSQAGAVFESARKGSYSDKTGTKFFKLKGPDSSRNLSAERKFALTKAEDQTFKQSDLLKSSKIDKLVKAKSTNTNKPAAGYSLPAVDSDSVTRILDLMKEASSMITLDDIIGKQDKLVSSRSYKQKMDPCRSITLGKVEGSCKAVRAATAKLEGGCSIEDAKAICEPNILNQISKWKGKLRVYLAPFIYGMRYTSFGRHFTKIDKLAEIVDKLHWYVNPNDTIVDFCCGANDFSLLMKDKLESTGKSCQYKNYDLFRPKNDFNFEERDWMTVQPKELPTGSQLIMGLNPPFGVKASLANQFINKALEFKPKLLILIVPQETERLDKKKSPYDLVWEDRDKLSGRSFYLPGSVDINDKQMEDWNVVAPVLYLWSRPDWTSSHSAIAKQHGHTHGGERETNHMNRCTDVPALKKIEHTPVTEVDDVSPFSDEPEGRKERAAGGYADSPKISARKDLRGEKHMSAAPGKRRANRGSRKKRHSNDMHAREVAESSREYKRSRSSSLNPHHGRPHCSAVNTRGEKVSPPLRLEHSPAELEIRDLDHDQFEPSSFRDEKFSLENESLRYNEPPSNEEIRDTAPEQVDPTSYMDTTYRRGDVGIPGGYYDDLTRHRNPPSNIFNAGRDRWPVDVGPNRDYASHVSPTFPDYPPQMPGEWVPDYMQGSEVYGVIHQYIATEPQRFQMPAYPQEPSYSRMAPMSAMDKYNPRLDEMNHVRMNNFNPDMGRPAGPSMYNNNQTPRPGYSGVPLGFATGPLEPPPPHHHGSLGGWIND